VGSFNLNISGNSQNVIGDNNTVTQTQNNGGAPVSVAELFEAIRKELPADVADDLEKPVVEPLQSLAETVTAEPSALTSVGDLVVESQEQAQSLINRLIPFAPVIQKATLAFTESALATLSQSNWVVAGLLAAVRAVKS